MHHAAEECWERLMALAVCGAVLLFAVAGLDLLLFDGGTITFLLSPWKR